MRERITYFHPPGAAIDPKQLEIRDTKVQGPATEAVREHKITLTLPELPSELASLLRDLQDLHLRWVTSASYETLEPFSSRVSPGLHVSYTPLKKDYDPEKLCTALQAFGRLDCSSEEVYISLENKEEKAPSTLFFYNELEKLDGFAKRLSTVVCSGPTAGECRKQLQDLKNAVSLDISYDSASDSVKLQALWPLQQREISVLASPKGRTEVGILGVDAPPNMEAHQIGASGVLTVIGEHKEPSPVIFAFEARHRAALGSFTSKFQEPTGLHPTLQLSLSGAAPPSDGEAECAPYAYFTFPKVIFADRYQLAGDLFLASKNLTATKYVSEPVDLEAPAYTTKPWGSNVLLELAPPKGGAAETAWTAEVPLHLRYLKPTPTGKEEAGIPYPVVFWACDSGEEVPYAVSPFDRVNLGYDGLFSPSTKFWHVNPEPEAGGRLINNIKVPVVTEGASQWVGVGTAAVVAVGFLWVLLKLVGGYAKSGHSTVTEKAEDNKKKPADRIKEYGVPATQARIKCMDYRDIPREKWDKITCLEMAEHVGIRKFNEFLLQVKDMLNDDGLFYLQIAGLRAAWQYEDFIWGLFMAKYVFPGADASMPLYWVIKQLECAGFEIQNVDTIGVHYSATIHRWYLNWMSNKESITATYGKKWFRTWEIFLAWSTIISRQGSATCYQIVAHKNLNAFDRTGLQAKNRFSA